MHEAKYNWQVTEIDSAVNIQLAEIATELSLPEMLVKLAYQRGYTTGDDITNYLSPSDDFHDPFLMHDMEKAVVRLMAAVSAGESILVYGDYDADGITSTTILMEALEMIGANAQYYLPNRFDDGYGPNLDVYKYYIKQDVQVILTCDNGVAGHEAIQFAQEAGVDVIVTDHHELPQDLPNAYAIVHPRHPEGEYPFGDLSGAGVALKLATALMGDLPAEFLDVAAIGTVADLVGLTDENRAIVQQGLIQMQRTERIGLQEFFRSQKIEPSQINEETIGFVLGPRLNALGRLGDASPGVELLMSFDPDQALHIVEVLEENNVKRREIVDNIVQEAMSMVEKTGNKNIIILSNDKWHEGVLGIVASRIVEKYHRPTILLTYDEDTQMYKGSGRSVEGVDIFALLENGRELATKFGGHAMACGMSIDRVNFSEWQASIEQAAEEFTEVLSAKPSLQVDDVITTKQITLENIDSLQKLRPFGTDNPKPLFLLEQEKLQNVQRIGKDKNTLKLTITGKDEPLQVVGFRQGDLAADLQPDDKVNAVVELSINEWNGSRTPQAHLTDISALNPGIFDLRSAKNRQAVFSVQDAFYLFEDQNYVNHYQNDLPTDAKIVLTKHLNDESLVESNHKNLVIFDCPTQVESIKDFVAKQGIHNIYVFAFSSQQAYIQGMPSREDFTKVYTYMLSHPQIALKDKEDALAKFLDLKTAVFNVIIEVFVEQELMVWQGDSLTIQPTENKLDLKQSPILKQRQLQIEAERFLLYNDIETIKRYFFQEDNE